MEDPTKELNKNKREETETIKGANRIGPTDKRLEEDPNAMAE